MITYDSAKMDSVMIVTNEMSLTRVQVISIVDMFPPPSKEEFNDMCVLSSS